MNRKWWHDKVAYQIYPKSFCDSNGDGIGDIPGVISKLDYLKDLGIDIIWLSPCYRSPLADEGYDISDYYAIDPKFGTMEDMDRLISEAKKRDMYILMDLVVNHCSDEHEWFQNAIRDPEGKYGKYFYIEKKHPDGSLPTNWRSYFGGPCWEDLPGSDYQYLHLFHRKQPDLNWENPEVREEVYKNIIWWLDKGLAGFRIDAIINIKKALPMHDYPVDREDGLSGIHKMLEEAEGVGILLDELADRTFRKYDAFTVGEVFNEKEGQISDFIGEHGYFSTMFDFNETICGRSLDGWYAAARVTAEDYKRCCFETQRKVGLMGFVSNIIENHDQARGVSRYLPHEDCNDTSKKMLAALNFLLRGLPFIYQGQEIGMENKDFSSIAEVDDVSSIAEYQNARNAGLTDTEALQVLSKHSRDNGRTPMQWNSDEHAGFTTGTPWLPVNPNYRMINVSSQIDDPHSLRSFYQELIRLRKNPEYKETIVYGTLEPIWEEVKNLMAYYRKGDKNILVVGNYQKESQSIFLPHVYKKVLLNNYDDILQNDTIITMQGYQVLVMEM